MKVSTISFSIALLLALGWTEPAAAVAYCPPEYQSCDGAGTPGGTWGGGSLDDWSARQYSNYIVIDCKTYGYCEYHP